MAGTRLPRPHPASVGNLIDRLTAKGTLNGAALAPTHWQAALNRLGT